VSCRAASVPSVCLYWELCIFFCGCVTFFPLTHLFAVTDRNHLIRAKCVYLFIYLTENALEFPRKRGIYFGSVFESWRLSSKQNAQYSFLALVGLSVASYRQCTE
jgi:hypothetical protein